MGRNSTGAITTGESLRINIKDILKHVENGYAFTHRYYTWTNGASINYFFTFQQNEKYLELSYTINDKSGNKTNIEYKIDIVGIPSNLGNGIVYYFICPLSYKRCRIIYSAYGSHYFKHRLSYKHRIYYNGQIASKLSRYNDRYWDLDKVVNRIESNGLKTKYKGRPTKIKERLNYLQEQRDYYDFKRWTVWPKRLMANLGI